MIPFAVLFSCAPEAADPTVAVAAPRELRAVWVASVGNIDFPSRSGLTAAEQQAELDALVATVADAHLNAIVFQVRPEGDALYASALEPWSRFLGGTQGQDPGYDPLAYVIEAAHARGIEVHAWFNPYRAASHADSALVAPHMALAWPAAAYPYGGSLWMDPGVAEVADRDVAVIADVVDRYDVDGVHFDDYFYPYPDGTEFPDSATYAAYQAAGGPLARDDWRRDNVNTLVDRVSAAVAAEDPAIRFGISPFGIYRPGQPEGVTGMDQYAAIYADPPHWAEQGRVDYLAPQLYWPTTKTGQAYGPLLDWWVAHQAGASMFAGNYLSKLGSPTYTTDEFRTELALTRGSGAGGNIWFSMAPLAADTDGIRAVFRDEFYASPAIPPVVHAVRDAVIPPPTLGVGGGTVTIASEAAHVRLWTVYAADGAGWKLDRVVPAATKEVELTPGKWAIAAVVRGDVESRGTVVEIGP
jgi:uncharacterized lipoprotein YddW (UPF0748 family)